MLARGEVSLADVRDKPVLTTAQGRALSFDDLARAERIAVVNTRELTKGEKIEGEDTVVLRASTLRALNVADVEDLIETVRRLGKAAGVDYAGFQPEPIDAGREYERRVRAYEIDDVSADLSKRNQARFAVLGQHNPAIVAALRRAGLPHLAPRTLRTARLVGACADTTGDRVIRFDTRYLNGRLGSLAGCLEVVMTLVHEYVHHHLRFADVHDFDFYKSFHDALTVEVLGAAHDGAHAMFETE
jgi:hypothetical protein